MYIYIHVGTHVHVRILAIAAIAVDSALFHQEQSQMSHDSMARHEVLRVSLEGSKSLLVVNPLPSASHRLVTITVDTHVVMVTQVRIIHVQVLHCICRQCKHEHTTPASRARGCHTYMQSYLHTVIPTYSHTYIHTVIPTCTCSHTYIQSYLHTVIHTYIQSYLHVHAVIPTYSHTYIQSESYLHTVYAYIRTYIVQSYSHTCTYIHCTVIHSYIRNIVQSYSHTYMYIHCTVIQSYIHTLYSHTCTVKVKKCEQI